MDTRKDLKPFHIVFHKDSKPINYCCNLYATNKTNAKKLFLEKHTTANIISIDFAFGNGFTWVKGTNKGYLIENREKHILKAVIYSRRDFDGITDSYNNTETIDYKSGLHTSDYTTGYHARYYDEFKNRTYALNWLLKYCIL